MIGFSELGTFVHEVETLTPLISKNGISVDQNILDLLEESCDEIASHVEQIIQEGQSHMPTLLFDKIRELTARASKQSQSSPSFPASQQIPDKPQYDAVNLTQKLESHLSSSEILWASVALPEKDRPATTRTGAVAFPSDRKNRGTRRSAPSGIPTGAFKASMSLFVCAARSSQAWIL